MKRNLKRLFKILKGKYYLLVICIVLLLIIQGLNFVSPLIVKEILDECILGIEYPWVLVEDEDDYTVVLNNHIYKQERHLDDDDNVLGDASVIIFKGKFYFTEEKIIDGKKELNKNVLTVKSKTDEKTYNVVKLSKEDVKSFYNPVLKTLYLFIILLFDANASGVYITSTRIVAGDELLNSLYVFGSTSLTISGIIGSPSAGTSSVLYFFKT